MYIKVSLDKKIYLPGALVTGSVEWDTMNDKPPKHVLISLLWHTEGKGTEDLEIIDQSKSINETAIGVSTFELKLPNFPWSYDGQLLSIVWCVEAGLGKGDVDRLTFTVLPEHWQNKAIEHA